MKRGAFTLIETMICIAILAIVMGTASITWLGMGQLRREGTARSTLRNGRQQLLTLEKAPFASLAPQVLKPDRQGWLQLGQREIVADSVTVWRLDGAMGSIPVKNVQASSGRVQVDPALAGLELMVDFDWLLPDHHEAHVVQPDGRVALANGPARQVLTVHRARGAALQSVKTYRLSPDGMALELDSGWAGQAVVVDYLGSQVRNRASGVFLSEDLQRLDSPSPIKLLEIREDAAERPGMLHLSTLRINR